MFNLNKETKMKSKPVPTRKFKNFSRVCVSLCTTEQKTSDYFPC